MIYYSCGDNMKATNVNSFDEKLKYKLYRTVYEIIHPTISKKNISSYRIVFNDEVLPVRVFYPTKVSNISKIIIYIPGIAEVSGCVGDYDKICKGIARATDNLVIALDTDDILDLKYLDVLFWCRRSTLYLYEELRKLGISFSNITLMGDSFGGTIALEVSKDEIFRESKLILFYPILTEHFKNYSDKTDASLIKNVKKYYKEHFVDEALKDDINFMYKSNILFLVGKADPLRKDIIRFYEKSREYNDKNKLAEIELSGHGFLDELNDISFRETFLIVNDYLK